MGFAPLYQTCGQLKLCGGKLDYFPLILLLFHNKEKFCHVFEDALSDFFFYQGSYIERIK